MDKIDVSDLPEAYIQAAKTIVETFRRELATKSAQEHKPPAGRMKLSVCEGAVIGNLSREEIYDDGRN